MEPSSVNQNGDSNFHDDGSCINRNVKRENEQENGNAEAATGTSAKTINVIKTSNSENDESSNETIIPTYNSSASELNLKPILKRKDSLEITLINKNQPISTLQSIQPPPSILKKRDLIHDNNNNIGGVTSLLTSNSSTLSNSTGTTSKPLSILKNRHHRGSQSFDDTESINIKNCVILSPTSVEEHLQQQQPLKPILKKKSFSTEEKIITGGTGVCGTNGLSLNSSNEQSQQTAVKSILKSSYDKNNLNSSSSSNTTNLDDTATISSSSAASAAANNSSNINSSQQVLKSILKSSSRTTRLRSSSLSPSNKSTDSSLSIVDDFSQNEPFKISVIQNSKSYIKPILKRNSLDSCITNNENIKMNYSSSSLIKQADNMYKPEHSSALYMSDTNSNQQKGEEDQTNNQEQPDKGEKEESKNLR